MTLEKTDTSRAIKVIVDQRLAKSVDHFFGVNKMIPVGPLGMNAEARELEAKIPENVVELLEA